MNFHFKRRAPLLACLALLLISYTRAQDKPMLRDFGSSLKNKSKNPKQPQKQNDDDDVVRVQTDLVVCDVLVVDQTGNIISGLGREDFTVSEDDSPQQIGTFSLGDNANVGRSIVLILDYSSSQLPYIKTSVEAAKALVDKLGPKDRMALVTDDVKLLVDFTQNKESLKEKLESLKRKALTGHLGQSLQYSALMATLNEMFDSEDVRPIIIFQTDGDQLEKLKDGRNSLTNFSSRDVAQAVERSRATL
jgi:VWFA-related protein